MVLKLLTKTYDGFVSGDLVLENCKCDAVFSAENALEILEETILDAIVCVSSEAVGAMEKSYKLTIEYNSKESNLANHFLNSGIAAQNGRHVHGNRVYKIILT